MTEKASDKKMNILIIEPDYLTYERLKTDLRRFSPYINKIFRHLNHSEFHNYDYSKRCKLIISYNAENRGLDFFKSFYQIEENRKQKIFGLIYTRGSRNVIQFNREVHYLYERSEFNFTGFLYKRFGNLEKILEIIRNIIHSQQHYLMIEPLDQSSQVVNLDDNKMDMMRKLYNMKYNLSLNLHPVIETLNEYNENNNEQKLKQNLKKYEKYSCQFNLYLKNTLDDIKEISKTISDEHKKIFTEPIDKFVAHKKSTINFINQNNNNISLLFSQVTNKKNNGILKNFLETYNSLFQLIQEFIIFMDEHNIIEQNTVDNYKKH